MSGPAPKVAGPGRPKGAQNKITLDIKSMMLAALDNVGGQKYLEEQAMKNPTAFMTMLGKIIPTQIQGDINNPLEMVHTIIRRILPKNE
jgi:hypothetical protein